MNVPTAPPASLLQRSDRHALHYTSTIATKWPVPLPYINRTQSIMSAYHWQCARVAATVGVIASNVYSASVIFTHRPPFKEVYQFVNQCHS